MATKKHVWSWALYDAADSAYAGLIPILLFPLYYKEIILKNSPNVDLWWGIAVGGSILIAGLLAPLIGALADTSGRRKATFITFSLLAILCTALLAASKALTPIGATVTFMVANTAYAISAMLYHSLLLNVATQKNMGAISSLGWGLGYAGGIFATLLVIPFIAKGPAAPLYWMSFLIAAACYLVFAMPAFFNTPEKKNGKWKGSLAKSFGDVKKTILEWRQHKQTLLFLVGFYFLTEGIVTIMYFFSLYATQTLHLGIMDLAWFLILNQLIALPVTIFAGKWSDRIGFKRIMIVTLLIWCATIIIIGMADSLASVYAFVIIAGFAVGTSQATARAWFGNIIPQGKRSQFFGFNAMASKVSATLGPVLFGIISVTTGNQRIAVFSILIYFMLGLVVFIFLPQPSRKRA